MKKLLTILFSIFVAMNVLAQTNTTNNKDTSKMCIPYSVAKQILIDLNDYDRLKELSKLDKEEIIELNKKIYFLEKTNSSLVEKDSLNLLIIQSKDEKYSIIDNEIKDLKKENKRLKIKNGLFNIISGLIIVPLTYIALTK